MRKHAGAVERKFETYLVSMGGPAPASNHSIHEEEQHRSHHGGNEASRFAFAVPAKSATSEAGNQRAGNAKQHRDEEAARIIARHQELRDRANKRTNE